MTEQTDKDRLIVRFTALAQGLASYDQLDRHTITPAILVECMFRAVFEYLIYLLKQHYSEDRTTPTKTKKPTPTQSPPRRVPTPTHPAARSRRSAPARPQTIAAPQTRAIPTPISRPSKSTTTPRVHALARCPPTRRRSRIFTLTPPTLKHAYFVTIS